MYKSRIYQPLRTRQAAWFTGALCKLHATSSICPSFRTQHKHFRLTWLPLRGAGLRIQRMPSEVGQEFGDPAGYPYMVVVSPSCHDVSTTRAWFEEDAGRRERFCADMLGIHVIVHNHSLSAIETADVVQRVAFCGCLRALDDLCVSDKVAP